jgi:hypothetical protein
VKYDYAPEAMQILAAYGLRPTPRTPPALVRHAINDLYRFEIRRLKQRLLAGAVSKENYSGEVIELRKHYWLLSIPVERWCRTLENP